MALSIVYGPIGAFDPYTRDQASLSKKIAFAEIGSDATAVQRATAQAELLIRPDFVARAKTTDNTAASEVIDLTDDGVTFPAASLRKIRFRSKATTDNDTWVQEWEQYVWGNDGTTPKLVGTARLCNAVGIINGTVVQYGITELHASTSGGTVTTTTARSSAGTTLGSFTSGAATLTHPIARASTPVTFAAHITEDAGTVTDSRVIQVRSATATTATVNTFDVQNATPAISSPNGVNHIDIEMVLLPPPSIALVMNSNNVEIHCGHDATDDVYHQVEVFIGAAESNALTAD